LPAKHEGCQDWSQSAERELNCQKLRLVPIRDVELGRVVVHGDLLYFEEVEIVK